jgi:hypothetical protein
MGVLTALESRLAFVRRFYFTAAPPFEAIRRECIPHDDPNDDDPPVEFEKWQEATKGLEVLGQFCLSLVHKAILDYLRFFVTDKFGPDDVARQKGGSAFDRYETLLLDRTTFRWPDSPVSRDRIEQIILCRNDFIHDSEIDSSQPRQSPQHFRKHPSSRFCDPLERAVRETVATLPPPPMPDWIDGKESQDTGASLTVNREGLLCAMTDAREFCQFVDAQSNREP